tara:strand:- start:44 stop:331 length:288 start_codon:yes stop_codon:yes gene_type:complete
MSNIENKETCYECCMRHEVSCPVENKDCRHWLDHESDLNCALIAVEKHGRMTLREISERMGVSFVRIKQIQDAALRKMNEQDIDFEVFLMDPECF